MPRTIRREYPRDCPRCGASTTVRNGGRFCDDPDCPWNVAKPAGV